MQPKNSFKGPSFIVPIGGFAFFSITIFSLTLFLFVQDSYTKTGEASSGQVGYQVSQKLIDVKPAEFVVNPEQADVGLPVRLKIPKINVNATFEYVGLTPQGAMGVPKLPRNVAWFQLGPRPGELGSAAIAGHVNWWNGATSVFAKLNKLKVGDKITVQDNAGAVVSFVVRKIQAYGSKDDVSEAFVSKDKQAHLNLITCYGVWDKQIKQYSKRLVVFSDKE